MVFSWEGRRFIYFFFANEQHETAPLGPESTIEVKMFTMREIIQQQQHNLGTFVMTNL